MKLIFATNNKHKVDEVRAVLPPSLEIITLQEAGIDIDIPEPHPTLEENAIEKAQTINRLTGLNCFSEDTGLEVASLDGDPGVKSARYAGDSCSFTANVDKLLLNMEDKEDRKAQFRTVICLILNGEQHLFEGICTGKITTAPHGADGFGYDPVFIPGGSEKTFAEMTLSEKNAFSHRRKAMDKLVAFLNTFY